MCLVLKPEKLSMKCLSHPIHKFYVKRDWKCKIIQPSWRFDTGKNGPYPGLNIVGMIYRLNDW